MTDGPARGSVQAPIPGEEASPKRTAPPDSGDRDYSDERGQRDAKDTVGNKDWKYFDLVRVVWAAAGHDHTIVIEDCHPEGADAPGTMAGEEGYYVGDGKTYSRVPSPEKIRLTYTLFFKDPDLPGKGLLLNVFKNFPPADPNDPAWMAEEMDRNRLRRFYKKKAEDLEYAYVGVISGDPDAPKLVPSLEGTVNIALAVRDALGRRAELDAGARKKPR